MARSAPGLAVVVLWALALSGAAVAGNGGLAPVEPASPNAEGIKQSYLWVAIFTGAIFVLVQGTLIWFIVRYRARNRARDEEGAQVHGNTNLELAWTVAPVLILVAIGSFVFYKLPGIEDVPSASAQGGRVDVRVEGYRYYWNFTYPNGVIAVDNLRAPVGQTVKLDVSAPDVDVIHSWWIPALGGKFDAIPGTTNVTWFNADAPGIYRGQCAEFCGIQHAQMRASSKRCRGRSSMPGSSGGRRSGGRNVHLGRETFVGACSKCHGLAGVGDVGHRLQGNTLLEDDAAIEQVVRRAADATGGRGAGRSGRWMP